MLLRVLQIVAAAGTIATGLVSLIAPKSVTGFTELIPNGGRGTTEIRAILGAFFVALGVMPLVLGSRDSYLMLGVAYLVVSQRSGSYPCSPTSLWSDRMSSVHWSRSSSESS